MILKHHATNVVQTPLKTEARLVTERKNAVDWHTRSLAAHFHLSLVADEQVELSLCRLNL